MPRGAKTGADYARQQQAQAKRAGGYSGGSVLTQAQQQQLLGPGGENEESESQAGLAQEGQRTTPTTTQSAAIQGPGFNPNQGGLSPNVADPQGFTREGATGVDRGEGVI